MATAVPTVEPARRRGRLRLPERLPNLKGAWLTVYSIVWGIILPLSLIGAAIGVHISFTTPSMWTGYGFATNEDSHGLHVDSVISAPARATGLKAGDYVVAIDGWAVPQKAARAEARSHVIKPDGSWTNFTIRDPRGRTFDIRLPRSMAFERQRFKEAGVSFPVARILAIAGSLLVPALFIPAAVLLFLRRRNEAVPAFLSLAFLLYAGIASNADMLGIGVPAANLVGSAAGTLLLAAIYAFPSGRFDPRWTAIPFLLLVPAFFVDWPLLGVAQIALALAVLVSRYRTVGIGPERLQMRWAFLGLAVGLVMMGVLLIGNSAVEAHRADDPRWVAWQYAILNPWAGATFCVMALGLIISILRYRLYDADAAIGRSAAYGMLTIGFVALFAGSEKLIELLGQRYLGQSLGGIAGGVAAAIAATAIAPMHARTHEWAERRFQKELHRLRNGLPALVGDLRETAGIHQIAAATLDTVMAGVRACRSAFIVGDTLTDARKVDVAEIDGWRAAWTPLSRSGIELNEADNLFPVRIPLEAEGHGRLGWLLLGPRPDGTLLGKGELHALEEVAEPVARAVQVVQCREVRDTTYEKRLSRLEERLEKLRSAISNLTDHRNASSSG